MYSEQKTSFPSNISKVNLKPESIWLPKNTLVNVSIWDNFVGNNIEAYLRPYKTFM